MLKVIKIALGEVGYLEKRDDTDLDSKTGNAGKNNYTKYARDLDAIEGYFNGRKQGQYWCATFPNWCLVQAYGAELAKDMTYQPDNSLGASCTYAAGYYKEAGRFYKSNPEIGDQIFFQTSKGELYHTGFVYAVTVDRVYTVEGNTSGASGVVDNGGGVFTKSYPRSYEKIAGYGRPAYSLLPVNELLADDNDPETVKLEKEYYGRFVSEVLTEIQKGDKGAQVRTIQVLLTFRFNILCGGVDGEFGSNTEYAVKRFQREKGLESDGVVGADTWAALLG